jgi:hypothetical protein
MLRAPTPSPTSRVRLSSVLATFALSSMTVTVPLMSVTLRFTTFRTGVMPASAASSVP